MRNLKTSDIYKMSKILKKLNVKVDTNGKTQEQVGAEIIVYVLENLYMAQDEVNDFIGDMVGMTGAEFNELPVEDTHEIIKQFKEIPSVANFLKLAGQLTK